MLNWMGNSIEPPAHPMILTWLDLVGNLGEAKQWYSACSPERSTKEKHEKRPYHSHGKKKTYTDADRKNLLKIYTSEPKMTIGRAAFLAGWCESSARNYIQCSGRDKARLSPDVDRKWVFTLLQGKITNKALAEKLGIHRRFSTNLGRRIRAQLEGEGFVG